MKRTARKDSQMKQNDEPCFPLHGFICDSSGSYTGEVIASRGITLRDYFAGQALAGGLAVEYYNSVMTCSTLAYKIADAMLAEREGGEG